MTKKNTPRKTARTAKTASAKRAPARRTRTPAPRDLQVRLQEAEQTLDAIRSGEVDAVLVTGPNGEQVFTLKGAEQTYRMLVEEMNDGAAILSPDGTILYCNRRLADLLRTPLQNCTGTSFSRFVLENEHATFEALLRQGAKDASQGELNLQGASGALKPASISLNAMRPHDEPGVGLVVTDLTAQKRNEEMVAAEKLARSILDQAAEAIIVCDEHGQIIRASQRALILAGRNPILQPFEQVFPLRRKPAAPDAMEDVRAGKRSSAEARVWFSTASVLSGSIVRGLEVRYARGEQSFDLLLSAGPLYNAQNEIRGCVISLTDITERARTQDQLRFQANVLQNVSESVIVTDIQGTIAYWNQGAATIFGYAADEMLGKSVGLLYPDRQAEELANTLLSILEGRDYVGEWEGQRKNGERIWVEIRTTLLRDADGRIIGFVGVAKDITDRRQARMALQARARQQAVVAELGQRALAGIELAELMNEAVILVAQTLGNEYCKVLQLLPDGQSLLLRAGVGWRAGLVGTATVGAGMDSQAGYTLQSETPVVVSDLRRETRFNGPPLLHEHGVVSGMSCVIRGRRRAWGVLGTHSTREVAFGADDVHFLEAVANVLAAAIERDETSQTLRDNEERYRTVAETASDAIITIDDQGVMTFVNSAAEKIFGYTTDEMQGQPLTLLMPGDQRERYLSAMQRYLQTGERRSSWTNVELTGMHKSGRRLALEASFGEFSRAGRHFITGIVRDVSARKDAERRLVTQYAVTRILSEAATIDEAIPQVLQAVCENLGWDLGVIWNVDREHEVLRADNSWHAADFDGDAFVAATCDGTRARGEGLPGQVWDSHAPVWVQDYHQQKEFNRAELAAKHGLRTALAFPISVGGEVYGIVECFNKASHEPNADLMEMLDALGSQIGQFIERKRTEEELRKNKDQLEIILRGITDGITVQEPSGRLIYANEAAAHVIGFDTPAELLATPVAEVLQRFEVRDESGAPLPLEQLPGRIALQGQSTADVLLRFRVRASGQERWSIVSASPVFDEKGQVQFAINIFRDITQRRLAEEAQARLAAIVESSYDGIIGKSLDGIILNWNPGAERLYQYTAAEAIGKPITLIMPPDRLEEFPRIMEKLRRGEVINNYETVRQRKDGRLVDVSVSIAPLRDGRGNVIGAATIARDISERKAAEQAQTFLAEASSLLASSLDYEQTLRSVAQLVVPYLADWCTIHVRDADDKVQQLALAHVDAEKVKWAVELQRRFPPNPNAPGGVAHVLRTGQPEYYTELSEEMLQRSATSEEHLQMLREVGLRSYMIVPMKASGNVLGAISFVSAESGRRYGPQDVQFAESLASRAALAIENARLYRHAQQLNTELEQRVITRTAELRTANANLHSEIGERIRAESTVRALFRVSEKLNSTLDLATLLDVLAQEALQLVNAARGCVGLREADEMVARKYYRGAEAQVAEQRWREGEGLPGWVLRHKSAYLTNDAPHDPQFMQQLPMNEGVRSALCVPIMDARGEVLGFFNIHNKRDGEFSGDDEGMLTALAQTAAIAIQNARAYQKIRRGEEQLRRLSRHLQSAREEERLRIAREIHDELGQVLTALKMDVSMLARRFSGTGANVQPAVVLQDIKTMGTLIDNTIQTVREIITELRPEMLEDLGLKAALEWQTQEFETRTGIKVKFQPQVEHLDLDTERAMALFRILQESLTNVARHANATQVDVELSQTNGELLLRVQDNGAGIEPSEMTKAKSFGILGMRERALLLGGELDIRGEPGAGTTVTVRVPLNEV